LDPGGYNAEMTLGFWFTMLNQPVKKALDDGYQHARIIKICFQTRQREEASYAYKSSTAAATIPQPYSQAS
jgi:hypothetical protein